MTALDPRQSVEFEPVAIGRRKRHLDPLGLGVALAVIGLVVAVWKPWSEAAPDAAHVGQAGATSVPPPSAMIEPPAQAVAAAARPRVTWDALAGAVKPHDGWGIQAFTPVGPASTGGRIGYRERWFGAVPAGRPDRRVVVDAAGAQVLAIGLTFPDGDAPLDVRIWSRTPGGTWRWLDARPLGRALTQGGLVFVPPVAGLDAASWGAGEYRIDVLAAGGTIVPIALDIPDRFGQVRPATLTPVGPTELVPSSQVDPAGVPVGAFATVDRVGVPLDGVGGRPLAAAAAWLDTDVGSGRAPRNGVAVAYLPRATGLGVRLPDGARVRAATLTRLAPIPFVGRPDRIGGGVIDHRTDDPWVIFAARRGEAWDPGVYRMAVTWADAAGLHDASWHVELRPGPYTGPPPALAIVRAWARHAGTVGVVVGRAEPLEGGPRSSAIRRLALAPGGTDDGDMSCAGTAIDGSPEAFGLTYPGGEALHVMRVRTTSPGGASRDVPMLQTAGAVPGLTLVLPTTASTFPRGDYDLTLRDSRGERVVTLCVGGPQSVRG